MSKRPLLFQCAYCAERFDTTLELEKHTAGHVNDERPSAKRQQVFRPRTAPRAAQACQSCAISKTKCDNERSCRRCQKKKIPCVRTYFPGDFSSAVEEEKPVEELTAQNPPIGLGHAHLEQQTEDGHPQAAPQAVMSSTDPHPARGGAEFQGTVTPPSPGTMMDDFGEMGEDMISADWDLTLSQNLFDFGVDGDFQLTEQDAAFLSSFPDAPPAGGGMGGRAATLPLSPVMDDETTIRVVDTFKETTGRWTPAARNFQAEEVENLTATKGAIMDMGCLGHWDPRVTCERITLPARDRLLVMMVSVCEAHNIPRVVSAFPSCDVLERLMRAFLTWHANQEDTWIHIPTFSVAEARVELLAAVIAGGAIRSTNRAVRKFGSAVHEMIKVYLRATSEKANILTRDLQFLQAYALEVQMALWTGNKRKVEMAAGFVGNLLNMLRSAGRYRRFSYSRGVDVIGEFGQPLDARWRRWLQEESFKRLVYHLHIYCSQESLVRSMSQPLSYVELSLPFPHSRQLWFARSADEWKMIFFESETIEPPPHVSVMDCLVDFSRLRQLPSLYDSNVGRLAGLYAFSEMIHSHRNLHMAALWGGGSTLRGSVFADDGQYRWLIRAFDSLYHTFRLYEPNPGSRLTKILLLDFLSMHLYASVDQIELLAGKEGIEEAQTAYAILQQWVESREARQSIWHAGQVIRSMRALPPDKFTDFHGNIIYHVSLCLWAYGTIIRKKLGEAAYVGHRNTALAGTHEVILDGDETMEMQKWIAFNTGRPVVSHPMHLTNSGPRSVISLWSTTLLMEGMIQIILSKYRSREHLLPATENICRLIEALGSTSRDAPRNL